MTSRAAANRPANDAKACFERIFFIAELTGRGGTESLLVYWLTTQEDRLANSRSASKYR